MARPLRIQAPGLTYHITARGVRRSPIYLDVADRRRFLSLLARMLQRYAVRCHAYCEMTNHYHLAVTTTDANLSSAMRQLNGEYASWWNWRHRHVGHVFRRNRANVSREVPQRDGRRSLNAIFHGAVTRAARNAAVVTAYHERYALTAIARYIAMHPSTVSKIVSGEGARA